LTFGYTDVLNLLEHFFAFSLVAETSTGCLLGGSALGKRDLKAEQVGQKAADELLQSINTEACVDSYSQDQVILQTLFFEHY
jgi:RNA 3'-terminal phosphate cyclase